MTQEHTYLVTAVRADDAVRGRARVRAVDAGACAVTGLLVSSSAPLWPTGPGGRTALELARH
ncbi:hypothetical protein [Streptomyces sp. NPDC001502]|uniref:hypothetical protein n=1 Tax=Streptomyces sp. NPDC001502 TaxID=3364578 RepID=UPI0036B4F489